MSEPLDDSSSRPARIRVLARKVRSISVRDLLAIGVPSTLLLAAGFWAASQFVRPAPPERLVITTGSDGGAYQYYAARYKPILARYGIQLVERPSMGSLDNVRRLLDAEEDVDVGFVQGGTAHGDENGTLQSLGSLYYEPLWVFYRGGARELTRLDQLAGKRIAVGPEGSGSRKLALELLEAHGIAAGKTQLLSVAGLAAAQALSRGEVDAVFVVGAAQSGAVWLLLHTSGVALLSFDQAEAYTRHFAYLSKLVLPHGAIDLMRNIPARDVTLVAPIATLVARADIHPGLVDLLLQAMHEVHREHGLFQRLGEFPSARYADFPLNQRAGRFYQSGPPLLQRYLPFWIANLIDRLWVMLVPVIALLIPLGRIAPQLYAWRVRSRLYRWYGELKFLEMQAQKNPQARSKEEWLRAVDRIEAAVNRIPTPLAYSDYLYNLRAHIALVRSNLRAQLRVAASPPSAEAAGEPPAG